MPTICPTVQSRRSAAFLVTLWWKHGSIIVSYPLRYRRKSPAFPCLNGMISATALLCSMLKAASGIGTA